MRSILKKKGSFELDQLQSVIITLVVVGIVAGLGLIVLGEFMGQTDDAVAQGGINDTLQAIAGIPAWLPLIILVLIIGIILAIVFRVLPGARGGQVGGMPMGY